MQVPLQDLSDDRTDEECHMGQSVVNTTSAYPCRLPLPGRSVQGGIVLFAALIALVTITLAALALIRSIDTNLLIAGNQSFKESCLGASDISIETATNWLSSRIDESNPAAFDVSNIGAGYYANWMEGCDMTGNKTPLDPLDDVSWAGEGGHANCNMSAISSSNMPAGYAASYIITRMCVCDGPINGICTGSANTVNFCSGVGSATGPGRFHGSADYNYRIQNMSESSGSGSSSGSGGAYYRIVTRVTCPRNTTSFVETIVTLE